MYGSTAWPLTIGMRMVITTSPALSRCCSDTHFVVIGPFFGHPASSVPTPESELPENTLKCGTPVPGAIDLSSARITVIGASVRYVEFVGGTTCMMNEPA